MSGPIVRRYGFPNFEKIFGERPIEHGVDEANPPADQSGGESTAKEPAPKPAPSKTEGTGGPKKE